MSRDRCHIYSLYWAAVTKAPFPACTTYNPEFDPANSEDNNIGYLTIGELEATGYTIGEYVIEWRYGSSSGDVLLVSGSSLSADTDVSTVHPLSNEPILSGTYYPVIRFVDIDGVRYGYDSSYDEYAPDLINCLNPISVQGYTCDNGGSGDYAHTITYINTSQPESEASRSVDFILNTDGSTGYVAINFLAYTVYDDIKLTYKRADGTSLGELIYYRIGSDLSGGDAYSNPIEVDTGILGATKIIADVTGFTYNTGDYVQIDITPNPTNSNTNWQLSFTCLDASTDFKCDTWFDPLWQEIDPCTVSASWNSSLCRLEVTWYQKGEIDTTSPIYNYIGSYNSASSNTLAETADQINGYAGMHASFKEDTFRSVNANTGSCRNLTSSSTITFDKIAGDGILTFSDPAEYSIWKTDYDNAKIWADSYYSSDPENVNHYLWYDMPFKDANSCGDSSSTRYLGFDYHSTVVWDGVNYTMTITPATNTVTYTDGGDCDDVREDLETFMTSRVYAQGINYYSDGTSFTTGVGADNDITASRPSAFTDAEDNVQNKTRNLVLLKPAYDAICGSLPVGIDYSLVYGDTFYQIPRFNTDLIVTDYSDPPVTTPNNFELYENDILIYKISGGTRTIPAYGECEGDGCVEYGYLYNWWAAIGDTDGDNVANTSIANTGWSLPSSTDYSDLQEYIEPGSTYLSNSVGGELKETGTTYWLSPNTGATNNYGFNGRGAGERSAAGSFAAIKDKLRLWNSNEIDADQARSSFMSYNNDDFKTTEADGSPEQGDDKNEGKSIRLIKDSPTAAELALADGEYADPYTGNDGQVYLTVKIGTQVWLAENLMETQYRNGDPIPTVEDATTWAGLTSGAKCAYNNDYTNVGCGITG